MVSLVFCPPRQPKPGSSTHHLHGLVEHAELNQRVEAGGQGGAARAWGRWNRSRWHRLAGLGQHGLPRQCPGPTWGLRSSLGEAGSTWGPTGLGGYWAHGGQRPAGAQPYLASMRESWAVARLSPEGRQLPPQVWVLGAWDVKGNTEGTY